MQRFFTLLAILSIFFVNNANAIVLMDEILPDETTQTAPPSNNGYINAMETNSSQMTKAAFPMTMERFAHTGYIKPNSDNFVQGNISMVPAKETDTLALLVAGIGLVLFIVRRRSGH